jgi:hypothetical protein
MDCKKESKRLKSKAHHILPTLKPVTRLSAKSMIIALIMRRKSPKVSTVTGRVRITSIGFTKKLRKLSTTATIMAVI